MLVLFLMRIAKIGKANSDPFGQNYVGQKYKWKGDPALHLKGSRNDQPSPTPSFLFHFFLFFSFYLY